MSDPQRLKRMQSSYNVMSGIYDRRYEINPLNSLGASLLDLVREIRARSVLEVGCGTGHWLKSLFPHVDHIVGLDVSIGMLNQGLPFPGPIGRVCGSADSLPFYRSPFDLIFAVNAIHHFDDKRGFIESARLLLRPAGAMAIVSMDMDSAVGHSVIYNYFPGALEYDRSRFPSWEQMESWMRGAGLAVRPLRTVETVRYEKRGRAILEDHFIQRHGTSQFMGLTDAQYQTGIDRLVSAISDAESRGEEAVFRTEFQLKMIVANT